MTYRGRIIFPFVAELAQLDTASTVVNVVTKEPTVTYDPVTGARTTGRRETTKQVRCQVETGLNEQLAMTPTGNEPRSDLRLVFHFEDLDAAGMIGADNRPTINVNDRLKRILTEDTGEVMQDFALQPMFATEVTPSGFGFGGAVNLLVVKFSDRPQAVRVSGG